MQISIANYITGFYNSRIKAAASRKKTGINFKTDHNNISLSILADGNVLEVCQPLEIITTARMFLLIHCSVSADIFLKYLIVNI